MSVPFTRFFSTNPNTHHLLSIHFSANPHPILGSPRLQPVRMVLEEKIVSDLTFSLRLQKEKMKKRIY